MSAEELEAANSTPLTTCEQRLHHPKQFAVYIVNLDGEKKVWRTLLWVDDHKVNLIMKTGPLSIAFNRLDSG
jgi:hypothetical protein